MIHYFTGSKFRININSNLAIFVMLQPQKYNLEKPQKNLNNDMFKKLNFGQEKIKDQLKTLGANWGTQFTNTGFNMS